MRKVVLSPSPGDTVYAQQLRDALTKRLPGFQFVINLNAAEETADALLVIVGPSWGGEGTPTRIVDGVSAALAKHLVILTVLMGGATMPSQEALPNPLRPLLRDFPVLSRRRGMGGGCCTCCDGVAATPAARIEETPGSCGLRAGLGDLHDKFQKQQQQQRQRRAEEHLDRERLKQIHSRQGDARCRTVHQGRAAPPKLPQMPR